MIRSTRRHLLHGAAATLALPAVLRAAETATEIGFYFPVAVGGPSRSRRSMPGPIRIR